MLEWQYLDVAIHSTDLSVLRHREEALAITILTALSHSVVAETPLLRKSAQAIQLVVDYMNDTPTKEISVVELCALADCSQRWLEQSFKKRFGVTPKAYMKYVRLARLRRELLQATHSDGVKVNDLASVYGFWHMGQLAADYRKVYHELPSTTLKKVPVN